MYNYPDELYHHGIKGQRWGKRNGPPYPLNPQTHAAVVRSADHRGSGKKSGKIGGIFERQVENPSRSIRRLQEKGQMDEKTRWTKKAIKRMSTTGAVVNGLYGAASGYAGARLAGKNKKTAAVAAGLGGAAGALGGALTGAAGAKIRNHIINKKIREGKIKGIDDEAEKKARRKKIARNIAIGAGATAAAAGLGYLAYKNRQKLLSRRLKGSSQPVLNGPVQSPFERAKVVGDGSGAIVPVRSVGKAAPNYKANLGKTGRKVRSVVTPTPGSGKKFKFTSRSAGTSIVPANTNRQLGFLSEGPRRLNWRRVAAAAGGAAALGGGTAAGISAYRRRKSRKRRR